MAKKSKTMPPAAPTTTQVMRRIAKTREAIQAAALARATKPDRAGALKKEGNLVKPPG